MPTDIVMPIGHEEEYYQIAKRLGYDTLVMAYHKEPKSIPQPPSGLVVRIASIDKPAKWADLCICRGKGDSRSILEQSYAQGVFGLESLSPKDFMHQRASGLNCITAGIAARKNKTIIFDFSGILSNLGDNRSVIIGRISQNIRVCRKAKTNMAIASMATNPYLMRSPHDLCALFCEIGMHPKEAADALKII